MIVIDIIFNNKSLRKTLKFGKLNQNKLKDKKNNQKFEEEKMRVNDKKN